MIFFFTINQRNLISGNFFSIHFNPADTFLYTLWFVNLNMIFSISKTTIHFKITKLTRETRIYNKSVIIRLNSQQCLRQVYKSPCCCSCQPAVLRFPKSRCICTCNHL